MKSNFNHPMVRSNLSCISHSRIDKHSKSSTNYFGKKQNSDSGQLRLDPEQMRSLTQRERKKENEQQNNKSKSSNQGDKPPLSQPPHQPLTHESVPALAPFNPDLATPLQVMSTRNNEGLQPRKSSKTPTTRVMSKLGGQTQLVNESQSSLGAGNQTHNKGSILNEGEGGAFLEIPRYIMEQKLKKEQINLLSVQNNYSDSHHMEVCDGNLTFHLQDDATKRTLKRDQLSPTFDTGFSNFSPYNGSGVNGNSQIVVRHQYNMAEKKQRDKRVNQSRQGRKGGEDRGLKVCVGQVMEIRPIAEGEEISKVITGRNGKGANNVPSSSKSHSTDLKLDKKLQQMLMRNINFYSKSKSKLRLFTNRSSALRHYEGPSQM